MSSELIGIATFVGYVLAGVILGLASRRGNVSKVGERSIQREIDRVQTPVPLTTVQVAGLPGGMPPLNTADLTPQIMFALYQRLNNDFEREQSWVRSEMAQLRLDFHIGSGGKVETPPDSK